MAKCKGCGKWGLFLKLQNGLCSSCIDSLWSKDAKPLISKVEYLESPVSNRSVLDYDIVDQVERRYKHVVNRHYQLIEDVKSSYKAANALEGVNGTEMEHVIALCMEDIDLAGEFARYYREKHQALIDGGYADQNSFGNALPGYPAFKRLAIIYEKQKKYDEAIEVCKKAIALGYVDDGTREKMYGRLKKLESMDKSQ